MRNVLVILGLICTTSVSAQLSYFTLGYGGNILNLSGINEVVDNYNSSRLWLDDEMKNFKYLDGIAISLGREINHVWVDLEYETRSKKRTASGTDLYGFYNSRDLKLKNNTIAITIGGTGGNKSGIGLGLRTEIGMVRLKTRVYGESYPKEKLENLMDPLISLKFGPQIKVFGFVTDGLIITGSVFYTYSLLKYNVNELDADLNGSYYNYLNPPEEFDFRPNTFGFCMSLGFPVLG